MSTPPTPQTNAAAIETAAVRGRSLWEDARARLLRNRAAVVSMIVLATLVLLATIGQALWIHDYDTIYRDKVWIPPTMDDWHLLGTDAQGRARRLRRSSATAAPRAATSAASCATAPRRTSERRLRAWESLNVQTNVRTPITASTHCSSVAARYSTAEAHRRQTQIGRWTT